MEAPFPHMKARAEAGKAASAAKKAKNSETWELIWMTCWRICIIIACTVAATLVYHVVVAGLDGRLHFGRPGSASDPPIVRTDLATAGVATTGDHFFIDIGMSSVGMKASKNSRHLEQKGWSGVCVVPFPGDFAGRTCKVVGLQVGADDGEHLFVPDCLQSAQGLQGLINGVLKVPECPQVETSTVAIDKILAIASAPKVIDYVSLDLQGSELAVLNKFPFNEHCVRAWSVKAGKESEMAGIQQFLEVSHGCRTRKGGGHIFGRCPCDKRGGLSQMEILPSGSVKMHKGGPLAANTATSAK